MVMPFEIRAARPDECRHAHRAGLTFTSAYLTAHRAFVAEIADRRVNSVPAPMPGAPERILPKLEFAPDMPVTCRGDTR